MAAFDRTRMCAECPFRKNSAPGWLGPWTIEEIEEFVRFEGDFICHVDVRKKLAEGQDEDEIDEDGQHCVGMLRYMNGMCKRSRDPIKADAQQALRTIKDQPVLEPRKFREHHESLK